MAINTFLFSPLLQGVYFTTLLGFVAVTVLLYTYIKKLNKNRLELETKIEKYIEKVERAEQASDRAIEEAKKANLEKEIFATDMNYEVRTAMNVIVGMAALLADNPSPNEHPQYIRNIQSCCENLLKKAEAHFIKEPNPSKGLNPVKNKTGINFTNKSGSKKLTKEFAEHFPLKILIAEDNPLNQELITRLLTKCGYNPDAVENGHEALEIVSEKNYDIIFMDVQMPEMDGYEATKMIRLCLDVQPAIIALTASSLDGDKEKCLQAGMDDYLSKPINVDELLTVLEKWALAEKKVGKKIPVPVNTR